MTSSSVHRRHILQLMAAGPLMTAASSYAQSANPKVGARGGVLNALSTEPQILNLGLDQTTPSHMIGGKIYEGLLTYDFNLNPQPGLARSWEVSKDHLTYTFKLHENVKWHDGAPFTADDVVFTVKEFLLQTHPRARIIFENCRDVVALDKHTVRFTLKQVFAPFLLGFEMSTAPMLPAHIYRGTNFRTNPHNSRSIGTGPFKLTEWKKGQFIRVTRNEDYYIKGEPYLDQILFHIVPDPVQRALALEQGRIQQAIDVHFDATDLKRLSSLPHVYAERRGFEFTAPVVRFEFNTRAKYFEDKRFRQAVSYSLDRRFIRETIFAGLGKVATSPWNSRTKFHDPNIRNYTLDTARAIALLDEMGLKPDANGVRARIEILRLPIGETYSRLAEYAKQALKRVGIEAELVPCDYPTWSLRYGNADFQMTISNPFQFGDPGLGGISRFFVSSNIRKGVPFSNNTGYVNPQIDELFAKGVQTLDEKERQAIYSRIQQILLDDAPNAWLVEQEQVALISRQFADCVTTAIGVNETYRRAKKIA